MFHQGPSVLWFLINGPGPLLTRSLFSLPMTKSLALDSMSRDSTTTAPSPNPEGIFRAALSAYKKKTNQNLKSHGLFKELENAILPAPF